MKNNMIEIEHGLSSQDFRLYDFLKKQDPNEWITQKEIALALPEVFPCRIEDMQDFHNSSCRHMITGTIRRLNDSGMITKIILSGAKGVKIATEEEFDKYISSHITSAANRFKRLRKLTEKAELNGQCRLKLGKYQKDIYEAFMD